MEFGRHQWYIDVMQMAFIKQFSIILLLNTLPGCSIFGIRSEEEPAYKILQKNDNKEIRSYSSHIVARATINGSFKDAQREGFKILAGYIFGKNQSKQKIAMTSPVTQEPQQSSEKIAMTAPVVIEPDNMSSISSPTSWIITFSMPSSYTLASLPTPNDKRVSLERIPERMVAAYKFSGFWGESKNKRYGNALTLWLEENTKYKAKSKPMFAGYNPPWTLPFLRSNEILVEISPK